MRDCKPEDYTAARAKLLTPVKEHLSRVGKSVENRESSCSVGGNASWCSCYGKKARRRLKKLKIELPYGLQDFPGGSAVKNCRVRHNQAHTQDDPAVLLRPEDKSTAILEKDWGTALDKTGLTSQNRPLGPESQRGKQNSLQE